MKRTITRLFDTGDRAEEVVRALENAGVPHHDISMIANAADSWRSEHSPGESQTGAGIGVAVGGAGGLLAGLGLAALPGIGPVAAAGWLAASLGGLITGAVAGGAAGSLIGALQDAGHSAEDAEIFAEGVRRGGAIVSVRIEDDRSTEVVRIFNDAVDVHASGRRADYDRTRSSPGAEGTRPPEI